MDESRPYPHIARSATIEEGERTISHPWNPLKVTMYRLSEGKGFEEVGA